MSNFAENGQNLVEPSKDITLLLLKAEYYNEFFNPFNSKGFQCPSQCFLFAKAF